MTDYYVTVRFKVQADDPDVARDQVKQWLLGIHRSIAKYKSMQLPPGVNRVFELSDAQEIE